MYVYLLHRKWPRCKKTFLHDLVMYFIYFIEESNVSRENLYYWFVCKEKQHRYENIYFNLCLMFDLLAVINECYVGKRFSYYKTFFLARIILFYPCLMRDVLAVIYVCFTWPTALYASVYSKKITYVCIRLFRLVKKLFMLDFKRCYHTYCPSQRYWRHGKLCNFIHTPICKLFVCRIYFMSI